MGSDEEPKPFQIVRVKKIVFHPQFKRDTLEHDIALLHLENDIRYDSHIGPICLDDQVANVSPSDNCVTTGWGKEVLKGEHAHINNKLSFFLQIMCYVVTRLQLPLLIPSLSLQFILAMP